VTRGNRKLRLCNCTRAETGPTVDEIHAFVFSQKGLMGGLGLQGNKIAKITPR
jgi:hypothetical protein